MPYTTMTKRSVFCCGGRLVSDVCLPLTDSTGGRERGSRERGKEKASSRVIRAPGRK